MAMKRALITGITGQDGSYLAELLLEKGYEVYGLVRRLSSPNVMRIAHILDKITLLQGDMIDQGSLDQALKRSKPHEIYNLAAMSHVGTSFDQPIAVAEYNGLGVVRLLEAMIEQAPYARLYQASTSEMFGNSPHAFLPNEYSVFHPCSPYATAKLFAHHSVASYRKGYNLFACSGILFNHESPRRGLDFVTRKITHGIARIKAGHQEYIELGNLNVSRDWGYAPDYVAAMWAMLQLATPQDYVIATGKEHTLKRFLTLAFEEAGLGDWKPFVRTHSFFTRPNDVRSLCGDATRAKDDFGWEPKTSFEEMVKIMVQADLERLAKEKL